MMAGAAMDIVTHASGRVYWCVRPRLRNQTGVRCGARLPADRATEGDSGGDSGSENEFTH